LRCFATDNLITVKYTKARAQAEPIKLSEPKIPVHLSPWFVVGFCEAEACFNITIQKSETTKNGFSVNHKFRLTSHKRDIVLLHMIKAYFNCGIMGKIDLKDCLEYSVSDQESISNIIIPFFNKYPLRGTKLLDYLDWVKSFEIVKNKEHLTSNEAGLNKIRKIKISLNTGRDFNNDKLGSNNAHLLALAHARISKNNPGYVNLDPNYISGFLVGDGYFSLISKIDSPSFGKIKVGLTQHINNYLLLQSIKDYFNVENFVISKTNKNQTSLSCGSVYTVFHILLPFFEKYPVYGIKAITLRKLLKIKKLIIDSKGLHRKTTKWTPELKLQILSIWESNKLRLKGDATVDRVD